VTRRREKVRERRGKGGRKGEEKENGGKGPSPPEKKPGAASEEN